MYPLVFFGDANLNLYDSYWNVATEDTRSTSPTDIQSQVIAKGRGRAVVNYRNDSKIISLTGAIFEKKLSFAKANERFDRIFYEPMRKLRIVKNYIVPFPDLKTSTWIKTYNSGSYDVLSATDYYNFYDFSNVNPLQGVKFKIDETAGILSYAGIEVNNLNSFSTASKGINKAFWCWEFSLYVPNNKNIYSIKLRVGNGSSFYEYGFISGYEGKGIKSGWNLFSVPWEKMSGSSTDTNLNSVQILVYYTSGIGAVGGDFVFSGLLLVDDSQTVNYDVVKNGAINKSNSSSDYDACTYSVDFLNYSGIGTSTHLFSLDNSTGTTNPVAGTIDPLNLIRGSLNPSPIFEINIISTSGITSLILQKEATGEKLTLTKNLVAGDVVVIGGLDYRVAVNGMSSDYSGLIPSFNFGDLLYKITFLNGTSLAVVNWGLNIEYYIVYA